MKNMNLGRTPGSDWLAVEVFWCTWDAILEPLHKAILYAYDMGHLHLSARRGIISLIPKKGKDGIYIKN